MHSVAHSLLSFTCHVTLIQGISYLKVSSTYPHPKVKSKKDKEILSRAEAASIHRSGVVPVVPVVPRDFCLLCLYLIWRLI